MKSSAMSRLALLMFLLPLVVNCDNGKESQESPESLGVFSETAPRRLKPDVDSFIGNFNGGSASISEFTTDTREKKEGNHSMKSTFSVASSGYAGWFVSWGNEDQLDNDEHTADLSGYSGGSLILWIKSPINLEVGIRSGNVPAGDEKSKVLLSDFSSFASDNTWHQVCIPLSRLEGASPKADLGNMKVLFVVASNRDSGGTGGEQETFWIDDVRWDKAGCP